MDTWIVGQTAPLIDPSQNIYNVTGSSDEGVTTLTFTRKRNTGDSRDNLIQNSAWKDYSAANSNYAFEAFESEEKHPGSLGQTNGSSLSSRPAQKPINSHPMLNYQGNGNRFADTRSLQRPKGYSHPVERSTYSLPRTQPQPPLSYYTHRPQRNSSDQLQPDFYFMPSQRKYSGEVVRVYVDYNNPHK
ncbi:hypothetical protein AAG570_012628 [Ranatra chinensis]|uniref:DOMON domain-containing protein n=1 Tax=Ranatra chinensis TaxID=642074 RepID=A0ABD0YF10_9HEMI